MIYSIFLRPVAGSFDTEQLCRWLELQPDIIRDPLGSGRYMICGHPGGARYCREKRIAEPPGFPYCILVDVEPELVRVIQEYGDGDELRQARAFVRTVIAQTQCEVLDEYGSSWTERVVREGVDVLYPATLDKHDLATVGAYAMRLAWELQDRRKSSDKDALELKDFLAVMADELDAGKCTLRAIPTLGPPRQNESVYEYPDGSLVRYRPLGDRFCSAPFYCVEIKADPGRPYGGTDDIAFRVEDDGTIWPETWEREPPDLSEDAYVFLISTFRYPLSA